MVLEVVVLGEQILHLLMQVLHLKSQLILVKLDAFFQFLAFARYFIHSSKARLKYRLTQKCMVLVLLQIFERILNEILSFWLYVMVYSSHRL